MRKKFFKKVLFSLTEREADFLKNESEKNGICVSELVRRILDNIIDNNDKDI